MTLEQSLDIRTNNFLTKSKKIHGIIYDYSNINYINSHIKVCIKCNIHGEFYMKPNSHTNGQGCPKCGIENRTRLQSYTTEDFVLKAKLKHNDFYNYSLVEYKSSDCNIDVICPIHGQFSQVAREHLRGCGCVKCSNLYKHGYKKSS